MVRLKPKLSHLSAAAALVSATLVYSSASAALVTTYYGDDDGFGFATPKTSGSLDANPQGVDNREPDEAPFTDRFLIGDTVFLGNPPFAPTGGFAPFVVVGEILAASLTIRVGAFDPNPPL